MKWNMVNHAVARISDGLRDMYAARRTLSYLCVI